MITEQQRNAVTEEVTGPMTAMFSAPYGADSHKAAAALRQYIEDLAEFPRDVLNAAWRNVRREYGGRSWPSIKTIRQAALDEQSRRKQDAVKSAKHWKEGFWDSVAERRDRFVGDFMAGTLARQAQDEGWSDHLREYVRKIAFYQAQIVERCERKGRAFSCRAKDQHGKPVYAKELIEFFQLEDVERHGAMTLSVPSNEIESMKLRARQQTEFARRAAGLKRIGDALPDVSRKGMPLPSDRTAEMEPELEDAFP